VETKLPPIATDWLAGVALRVNPPSTSTVIWAVEELPFVWIGASATRLQLNDRQIRWVDLIKIDADV
jgi:hypothetical protein